MPSPVEELLKPFIELILDYRATQIQKSDFPQKYAAAPTVDALMRLDSQAFETQLTALIKDALSIYATKTVFFNYLKSEIFEIRAFIYPERVLEEEETQQLIVTLNRLFGHCFQLTKTQKSTLLTVEIGTKTDVKIEGFLEGVLFNRLCYTGNLVHALLNALGMPDPTTLYAKQYIEGRVYAHQAPLLARALSESKQGITKLNKKHSENSTLLKQYEEKQKKNYLEIKQNEQLIEKLMQENSELRNNRTTHPNFTGYPFNLFPVEKAPKKITTNNNDNDNSNYSSID